jgi:hypothetical protein
VLRHAYTDSSMHKTEIRWPRLTRHEKYGTRNKQRIGLGLICTRTVRYSLSKIPAGFFQFFLVPRQILHHSFHFYETIGYYSNRGHECTYFSTTTKTTVFFIFPYCIWYSGTIRGAAHQPNENAFL